MRHSDSPPRSSQALFGLVLAVLAGLGWAAVQAWHWLAAWWAG
ncbi:hypothetical protein [Hymenobacter lapidarius]|nr:hypothetical protein [Hymenobacter lapidarius]